VVQKRCSVLLDETAIAQQRLNSRPLVLGCDLWAHLKTRRMAGWTIKWTLVKDACAAKHGDALGGSPLTVVGLLGPHALGDEVGPLALPEILEAVRPGNVQADDFRHAAVVAEEVLGPRGSDVPAGDSGVERRNARPFLDGVDQVRRGRIGEGVGHLFNNVVGFDQADDGSGFGGPEVFEAAEVSVLAAGEKSVEMLGEDREIAVRVVDACVVMVGHRDGEGNLDVRAFGGQGEAVDEGVVGVLIGA